MKSIRENREALLAAVEDLLRRVEVLEEKKPKATAKK